MSESDVTRSGLKGQRPGREAPVDDTTTRRPPPGRAGRRRGRRGGEQPTVPDAEFRSYYGLPVINKPVWEPLDIAGYLFLGGLAGASSLMAAVAGVTGQPELGRVAKVGAASAAGLSLVALVHDLGRPERFVNMLRVVKVTSPMSVGSWLLAAYGPATIVAAASDVTGRLRPLGTVSTGAAAALGPAVASYTAVLLSDTAVPAWHDGFRELPFVFVASAALAAGGLGLVGAPTEQHPFPRRMALVGAATEYGVARLMERRMGMVAEPYHQGKSGRFLKAGQALAATGAVLAVAGRGHRRLSAVAGALFLTSSAASRFGIFHAGIASAEDPRYTIEPQRERIAAR